MFMVLHPAIGKFINSYIIFSSMMNFKRFEVNLANRRGDVVLHINPRLNDRQLVLNAAPGGGWGAEDRKPLNITRGQQFSIIIMVTAQGFKVKFK
jgi:hypothetical protein